MATVVGVVAETRPGERRTALVPGAVADLVAADFRVLAETGCGSAADLTDEDFARAGAVVVESAELYQRSQVIVCVTAVRRPARLHRGHIMVGMLQPWRHPVLIQHWLRRGVTMISLDSGAGTARAHGMDASIAQGRIAGRQAVLLAEQHFGGSFPMIASDGRARPVSVLILGAGVVGLQSMSSARLLGADVTGYTGRPDGRTAITSRGARFLELGSPTVDRYGVRRELSDQECVARRHALDVRIGQFDVVITAAGRPGHRPPRLVSERAIAGMRPGSVIVDIAASGYGGNVVGSRPGTTTMVPPGIRLIGAGNLAAQVPRLASEYYADNVVTALRRLCPSGEPLVDLADPVWSATVLGHHSTPLDQLNSRVVLEQAKGVLAERLGIGVPEAFAVLRDCAHRHGVGPHELAGRVLNGDPEELRQFERPNHER